MVPGAGLEPARCYQRGILNPLCLPISPPGHWVVARTGTGWTLLLREQQIMEAEPGVEPR